jgi:hypothetical protein
MTNCIQFIDLDEDFVVSVTYETGEDISKISLFESTRIKSLQDRKIKIKSEVRIWDSVREISVRNR